jgi:hypothetical protein
LKSATSGQCCCPEQVPDDGAKRSRTGVIRRAHMQSAGDNQQPDRDTYEGVPRHGDLTLIVSNLPATLSRSPVSGTVL